MAEPTEKAMRMRTYVLKEIFKTEKDYVDTLKFLSSVSLIIHFVFFHFLKFLNPIYNLSYRNKTQHCIVPIVQ